MKLAFRLSRQWISFRQCRRFIAPMTQCAPRNVFRGRYRNSDRIIRELQMRRLYTRNGVIFLQQCASLSTRSRARAFINNQILFVAFIICASFIGAGRLRKKGRLGAPRRVFPSRFLIIILNDRVDAYSTRMYAISLADKVRSK